ncbi:DNA-directed RNA polymerase subunit beta [Domibacillus aminovorans]|nr:DNA-directed RNA polymerase subunit beta [Domibacillus aminovorans]
MLALFTMVITAVIGALIGYSIIGTGDPIEVFMPDTWIHLSDVIVRSLF